MPRYHSLDTEVQLHTWSPLSCQPVLVKSSVPVMGNQAPGSHSTSPSVSEVPKSDLGFSDGFFTHYRDRCRNVKRLNEEYFKGRKGLDFLGYDAPFFLILAGNEATQPSLSWIATKQLPKLNQKRSLKSSEELIKPLTSTTTSPTEKEVLDRAHESPRVNEHQPYPSDYDEIYSPSDESPLSSPPSAELFSLHDNHKVSEESHIRTGGQLFTSFLPPKAPKWSSEILGTPSRAQILRNLNETVQVVVKLSEKSFIYPVFSAEDKPHDICINLFCNGEFYRSHIVRYSTWAADGMKNYLTFGTRCTGICHEVPQLVHTSGNSPNTGSLISESPEIVTPLERWDKLTRISFLEAKKWGIDECGCTCPTGEYLELLSGKTMPFELNLPPFNTGSGFGVIDVVITLGRALQQDNASGISSPTLNLSNSQSQTAGKVGGNVESRMAIPSLARSGNFPEDSNENNYHISEVDSKDTKPCSSAFETSHIMAVSPKHVERIDSTNLGGLPTTVGTVAGINPQSISRRSTLMSVRSPTTLATVATPRPPHPNRPENAPQKTYRGSEPLIAQSPSTKLQKTAKLFEELPFDLNTAAYMSTRARRSASIPFAQTPPKAQLESSLKRKRSAFSNCKPSEESNVGTSSMPKRDKPINPKTPESGGPVKKKLRTSNYNPKLSNRPQNLRRKNSAGEWIIPPCRKNSSGEWETPTKDGQAKAAGLLGIHTTRVTTSENEKIFQPDFNMPVENTSPNVLVAAKNMNSISVNKGKATLKENKQQNGSARGEERIAPKIIGVEENNYFVQSANPRNRSNDVAITARDNKVTSSTLTTIFRGVKSPHRPAKNTQTGELLVTSPTAAGAIDFENFFGSQKMSSTILGKNPTRKRILCLIFFEGNINSAGEIVDVGYGSKRWLARRCTTPGHFHTTDSGKEPVSNPTFEQPNPKTSALASPRGEKVEDVLTDLATARSGRKPGSSDTPDLGVTKNSIIAFVRNDEIETSQQLQISALTLPRRGLVIPNHNSRVLRLTNRQSAAKQTYGKNEGVPHTTGPVVGHNIADDGLKIAASSHLDRIITSSPSVLGRDSQQATGLKHFPTVRSFDNQQKDISDSVVESLVERKPQSRDSESEEQIIGDDQVSAQMLNKRVTPETLPESHDHHSDTQASLGSQPRVMSFQPLMRASKKAIRFKPPRVTSANNVISDKSIVQNPIKSDLNLRKRSSSGQFIEEAKDAARITNRPQGKNEDLFTVVNAQIKLEINTGASGFEVKKPSWRPHRKGTLNGTVMPHIEYDLSLLGAGETPKVYVPAVQTTNKASSKPQKDLEIPRRALTDLGGEILQNDASNAVNFEDAASEVDMALNQMSKARAQITKTNLRNATHSLIVEEPVANMHESQPRNTLDSSVPVLRLSPWKPGCLCDDSITEYAQGESWDRLKNILESGHFCGRRGTQQDGNFKALGVLMGVRYVVVGSHEMKECEIC